MNNVFILKSLYEGNYTTRDKNIDSIIATQYKSIKNYIEKVITKSDNKVIVMIKDRVKLQKYRNTVKNEVAEVLLNMTIQASNAKNSKIGFGVYVSNSYYFNVGNISVTINHTIKDPTRIQRKQVKALNDIFKSLNYNIVKGDVFNISIGGEEYTIKDYDDLSIVELPLTKPDNIEEVKADCRIDTKLGIKIYLSLKGNTSQQWGGLSKIMPPHTKSKSSYSEVEKEVEKFVNDVKTIKQNNSLDIKTYTRKIISDELKYKSIFGLGYGKGNIYSEQNVNHVIIGEEIQIRDGNNIFTNKRIITNTQSSLDEEVYLLARYQTTRSDFNVPNTRFMTWPGLRINSTVI
jgi:hypothetical protein